MKTKKDNKREVMEEIFKRGAEVIPQEEMDKKMKHAVVLCADYTEKKELGKGKDEFGSYHRLKKPCTTCGKMLVLDYSNRKAWKKLCFDCFSKELKTLEKEHGKQPMHISEESIPTLQKLVEKIEEKEKKREESYAG